MSHIAATQREKVLPLSGGRTKGYPQVAATTATVLPRTEIAHDLGLCHALPSYCHCQDCQLPLPHPYRGGSSGSSGSSRPVDNQDNPPRKAPTQ